MFKTDVMIYGYFPSLPPSTYLMLWVAQDPRGISSWSREFVCIWDSRQPPNVLAWERKRKSGLNHLLEPTMNLNTLNDQGSMNRDIFSSTLPSIGNCSIFSNTQSKSIFLKVPVTVSSFSPGNEAAANHSFF